MSTFLQLCSKLRQKTIDVGTGPTTVVSQVGQLGKIVTAIDDAWVELQQEREDWRWMRKSFTVPTVASTGEYAYNATSLVDTVSLAAITRFGRWYQDKFTCYLTATGVSAEYQLFWMEWDTFKRLYRFGTQTDGQPAYVSIDPTGKFCLGPKPDAVYTVKGDYQIGPQIMSDADDPDAAIPEMPTRFHGLITYRGMIKYGLNAVAPEAIQEGDIEGIRLRNALELDQLPGMQWGDPLA